MKSRNYMAFIVEGESREPQIINNLQSVHFKHSNFMVITLPAGQNIYMLWQRMNEDDFETDIIEILRENSEGLKETLEGLDRDDFSQIFLFFDYDGHQDNLPSGNRTEDVLEKMLVNFDNETENGKLYINYPMVEALRDFEPGVCGKKSDCYCQINQFADYKQLSADRRIYNDLRKYDFEIWRELLNVFAMRVSCLFNVENVISHDTYCDKVNPYTVYNCQKNYILHGKVFILSGFPEFLLDYFPAKFWNACIKCVRKPVGDCQKDSMKLEISPS